MRPCKNVPKKSCEGLSTEGGIFFSDVYAIGWRISRFLGSLILAGELGATWSEFCMGQLPGESTCKTCIQED